MFQTTGHDKMPCTALQPCCMWDWSKAGNEP